MRRALQVLIPLLALVGCGSGSPREDGGEAGSGGRGGAGQSGGGSGGEGTGGGAGAGKGGTGGAEAGRGGSGGAQAGSGGDGGSGGGGEAGAGGTPEIVEGFSFVVPVAAPFRVTVVNIEEGALDLRVELETDASAGRDVSYAWTPGTTSWEVSAFDDVREFSADEVPSVTDLVSATASFFVNTPDAFGEPTQQAPGSATGSCYDGDFICTGSPDTSVSWNVFVLALDLPELFLSFYVDWNDCCLEHDRAFFCGGSLVEFAFANENLERCMADTVLTAAPDDNLFFRGQAKAVGALARLYATLFGAPFFTWPSDPDYAYHGGTCLCSPLGAPLSLCDDPCLLNDCSASPIERVRISAWKDHCPGPLCLCSGEPFSGYSSGDPHFRTLDGLGFDFQGTGEFLLVGLADDESGARVQVRQEPLASADCPNVTLNTAVAAAMGGNRVALYADQERPLWIDGVPTSLEPGEVLELAEGHAVVGLGNEAWDLAWGDAARVRVTRAPWRDEYHLNIAVFAPPSWSGRTHGLLGDFDGSPGNDFKPRGGSDLGTSLAWQSVYVDFGESYRVSEAESLFDYQAGEGWDTFVGPPAPDQPPLAWNVAPQLLDGVEAVCDAAGAPSPELYDACILDVACSGDAGSGDWVASAPAAAAVADIIYEDRFAAQHCTTLAPSGSDLLERLALPLDGSTITTSSALELGRHYELRVWGTAPVGAPGDGLGDADYMDFSNEPASVLDSCGTTVDFGVGVNSPPGGAKTVSWGSYCSSHSYTMDFTGQGAPVAFTWHDCNHNDNVGTLNIDVYAREADCDGGFERVPATLDNGSFEVTTSDPGNSYVPLAAGSTELSGWTLESGTLDVVGGSFWVHADGVHSLDLNGTSAATISQVVATEPGAVYEVAFALAGNRVGGPAVKSLEITAGSQSGVFQFDTTGTSYSAMDWSEERFVFRASSETTTLRFRSLDAGSGGPALDYVRLANLVCGS